MQACVYTSDPAGITNCLGGDSADDPVAVSGSAIFNLVACPANKREILAELPMSFGRHVAREHGQS